MATNGRDDVPIRVTSAPKTAGAPEPDLMVHKPSAHSGPVTGVVLLLHGGEVASERPVSAWSLPLARMRLFVAPVQTRGAHSGVAVAVLRNRVRGWNGEAADAYVDAEWALDQLAERFGPVPVALIGHSMGGRAALRAGGHASVTGIAALAPWVPEGEPIEQLAGRTVLIAHGDLDTSIAPAQSLEYAERLSAAGVAVCRLRVPGSGHALLSRLADWNVLAADFALAMVGAGTVPDPVARALAAARKEPGEQAEGGENAETNATTTAEGGEASVGEDPTGLDTPLARDWRRRSH